MSRHWPDTLKYTLRTQIPLAAALIGALALCNACEKQAKQNAADFPLAKSGESDTAQLSSESAETEDQSVLLANLMANWTGDYGGMIQRRVIRLLTPYSRTHYFIDNGVQHGLVYDAGIKLEEEFNKTLKTSPATKVNVVFLPTLRDDLYRSLVEGRGDLVAANITVTPERAKLVDFTVPGKTGVREIVVTGPGAPVLSSLDELGGKDVYVRANSIQYESLMALNETFKLQGKAPLVIRTVPTSLEDEDILEMVNAGLLKATIVGDFIGEFWKQILPDLILHPQLSVREDGDIAWAVRKGSPKFIAMLNLFVTANKQGTLTGNSLLQKYLKSVKYVRNATSEAELRKFTELAKSLGSTPMSTAWITFS